MLALLCLPALAHADNGRAAWLRYAPLGGPALERARAAVPATLVVLGRAPVIESAGAELTRGLASMLDRPVASADSPSGVDAVVVGTLADVRQALPGVAIAPADATPDGYWLQVAEAGGRRYLVVAGSTDRGTLYGAFGLLRRVATGEPLANLHAHEAPYARLRWINQWDNLNGTIERGYGGRSIFWDNGHVRADLSRVSEYGRLLASLGITAVSVNNVNADPRLLSAEYVPEIARIADALRPWGVGVAISIDFGSPQSVGKLDTYDPLDPTVAAWWRARADALYAAIPDFAGFVLKADSEGRVGPSTYGRTHADAANVVARALAPHGGVIFYRGFVYDHHMDWRNLKNDRARAAYDNFHPLDGQFDDNVVIQVKNGPIDFQVREPASPLFGGLAHTNEAIELQVTQEYMGQARHTVFLPPMWKATLDFDTKVQPSDATVKAIVSGRTFDRPTGGFVGVANVGLDDNWLRNDLSQANLYGFGRLAWDPDLSSEQIVDEWTKQTFGSDPDVVRTIERIQLTSWRTYENYTGPLGLQTLTAITGDHYGVAVEASERNGWGQWHRADHEGVGMDRTVATGTGYIGQYAPSVAAMYESLDTCPDDLVLFMHHVPYTYRLHSGQTVIQYLYDSHYEGAEAVAGYVRQWKALKGKVDAERYDAILAQLEYQAGQAVVWRDAVTRWFHHESGIADARGRVGTYPGRLEAEAATLTGYVPIQVTPWEGASGGGEGANEAVECPAASCTATFRYDGPAGRRDLVVQYFDVNSGAAHFRVRVGSTVADEWTATDDVPSGRVGSSSSARRIIRDVNLTPGETIAIEGTPDARETAALDYIEIHAAGELP
jgi:alpha-glucuronidase